LITGKANIVVSINSVRQYKTKKGKNPGQIMAFLCAEDSSGMLDSITIFPETYSEYKDLLTEGNTVYINGEISKKENTSLIVNKVTQV
jgi:DNA polymerase-3 subunit alpha